MLDTLGVKTVAEGPVPMRSPSVDSVLTWRQQLAIKYRGQLAEALTWDETSSFESSEDVSTHGDVLLRYAAAVLDERGDAGIRQLAGQRGPSHQEFDVAFREADRRGFGGRFPQLLLGASIWLPFEANLMIEEPNWDGQPERYGSVVRLVDELTEIRAATSESDPTALRTDADPEQTLVAAWQTSATVLRLAQLAVRKRLPLWTTG